MKPRKRESIFHIKDVIVALVIGVVYFFYRNYYSAPSEFLKNFSGIGQPYLRVNFINSIEMVGLIWIVRVITRFIINLFRREKKESWKA